MEIYKVGGSVRDRLLGRPAKDCDWVVVGATAQQLEADGYRRVGTDFPVFLHPVTKEEYALARTERKTAPGHKGFEVDAAADVSLEEDLRRRDLTINAIAEAQDGTIIDPYGGQKDLAAGVLRHVSPAFVEDPLRVLRVARFAARFQFSVAPETLALMKDIAATDELATLTPERIWTEWQRALTEQTPRRFIEVLRECGALEKLFPDIDRLFGVPQPPKYHPEIDTGVHMLLVMDQAARLTDDPRIRFAALMHDLGKGTTPTEQWPGHRGHEERGVELINACCARYKVPTEYHDLAVVVARYHTHCHRAQELRAATLLDVLEGVDAFRRVDRFDQFLIACEADARGRTGLEQRSYPQTQLLRDARAAAEGVDVRDLAGQDLSGEKIATQLRQRRVEAIARLHPPTRFA